MPIPTVKQSYNEDYSIGMHFVGIAPRLPSRAHLDLERKLGGSKIDSIKNQAKVCFERNCV